MSIAVWIVGLAIAAWLGAMGVGALAGTNSATRWFQEMLGQSQGMMRLNGIGLVVLSAIVATNLFAESTVSAHVLRWALGAAVIVQLSTLFMLIRGDAPRAAIAGPIVLLGLLITHWFLRT